MADKQVRFSEDAEIEFHKAKCYMGFTGKEEEFWLDVDKQLDLIVEYPEAFRIRYKNIRMIPLERFNYSIHYTIKPYGILVYRFLNQRQDF